MSKEIIGQNWNSVDLYKNSGGGSYTFSNGTLNMAGYVWVASPYIEIDPSLTYTYDVRYTNTSGSLLYIGYEKYDASKTSTSNNSCTYFLASSDAATNKHIEGTVNLATDSNGASTKYIKLRILNRWNSSSDTTTTASISTMSLRGGTLNAIELTKPGVVSEDELIEYDNVGIYKSGIIEANHFIEY